MKHFIKFGKWNHQLDYIDQMYQRLATRLIKFAQEAGPDPYDRYFDAEPFLDFVIKKRLYDKSVDYMYRHYVYHLLSQEEDINVELEEFNHHYQEFIN